MIILFKKIFLLIKKILTREIKIRYGIPQDIKIVVYNSDSIPILQNILENDKFIILDSNLNQIKEIYFSLKLFLMMFSNISKFRLSKNYFYSILKLLNPKLLITGLGNHTIFYELAKLLDKEEIEFFAVQNARRSDFERNDYDFKKKITSKNFNTETYIPHFFCFGQYEIDSASFFNVNIKKLDAGKSPTTEEMFKMVPFEFFCVIMGIAKRESEKADVTLNRIA